VALSLYYFIKWLKFGRSANMALAIIMLGIASAFHSGVVGLFLGYAFAFLFYKRKANLLKFNSRTVFVFAFLIMVSFLASVQFNEIFLAKFEDVESINDVYKAANSRFGDSAYLTGLTINNPIQLILYTPIKMLFFLASPVPIDWRGII